MAADGFKLSPQQRHAWSSQEGSRFPLAVAALWQTEGPLDPGRLRAALTRVVARHEILRTRFRRLPGMPLPLQVVETAADLDWQEEDLAPLPAASAELAGRLARLAETSWDPQRGPVLRVALLRRSEASHALLASLPAVCGDAVSLDLLLAEAGAVYDALGQEEEPALADLMQVVDHAVWQLELLQGEESDPGRAWWAAQDLGALAVRLPWEDRADGGFQPVVVPVPIPAETWRAIEAFCARAGSSPDLFLLAVWNVLVGRAMQLDAAVAVSLDGRKFTELEAAIGPYSASLPVRVALGPDLCFRDVLAAVSQALIAAYEHLEFFDWTERADLGAGGEEPCPPCLFEHESRPDPVRPGGLIVAPVAKRSCAERFRLKLTTVRGTAGWSAELWHDVGRVSASSAARAAEEIATLAAAAVAAPETPLADLEIVGPAERALLAGIAGSPFAAGDALPVHRLILEQARRGPQRIAVEAQGLSLAYGELGAAADRLARRLRGLGVGPEVPVGLLLDRSPEMLIAIVAVLAAGGAYVPLDPSYPSERLAYVLAATGAPVVLTRESLAGLLGARAAGSALRVLCLDAEEESGGAAGGLPPAEVLPENLAYILFTSGSTGRPKGVQVSHRNLAISTAARFPSYEEPVGRYLLASSFAFDSSVAGIFWTLCQGGTLVLPRDGFQQDLTAFVRELEAQALTHLLCLPGLWRVTLEQGDPARLASLRTVIVAGEACPPDLVDLHARRLPSARLYNEYGPTEASVWSTVFDCGSPRSYDLIPIGRPVGDARIHLLDGGLRPVPMGASGEVYIGGGGVARGYHGRPELTAERFMPDPSGGAPGARLYRTGDLARFLPDACLDFQGRADHQVKIRGFRIELGEIEIVLRRHGTLRDAIVVALDEPAGSPRSGEKRLAAYVVPAAGAHPSVDELRRHARESLPDFMVPTAWVLLAELPLTPNGKLDRKALPAPDEQRPEDATGFVAPRTPAEEVLAAIWAAVLGLEAVGVQSDFFEIGGNSLVATQLVARVRSAFRVEVPQRALFQHPTVAAFAAEVEMLRRAGESRVPPLEPRRGAVGPAPLSLTQERLWFFDQLHPGSNAYNLIYPVDLAGPLDVAALLGAMNEISRRHEVLRARFRRVGSEPCQEAAPADPQPVLLVDFEALPEDARRAEAQRLAVVLQALPFSLAAGPLQRNALLRLGPRENRLLVVIHQIVFDGWLLGLLAREFAALYSAAVDGRPSPLPELPLQYADFARWQRDWMCGEVLDAQMAWWRTHLGDRPRVAEILPDRPRVAGAASPVEQVWLELPAAVSAALRVAARQEGATPFMFVLAVLQTLIHRYTGEDRASLGTLVANRSQPGIESLMGFFVNTLPLSTDLSGGPPFRELLARVRQVCFGATDHQDLPFEKVIEALNPERTARGQALFQMMYVFQNAPLPQVELPGVTMAFPRPGRTERAAAFDLSWTVMEESGALVTVLEYDRDLFDGSTARHLAGDFENLLRGALDDPSRPLSTLPLSSGVDIAQRAARAAAESAAGVPEAPVDSRERAAALRAEVDDRRAKLSSSRQELLARRLRRDPRPAGEAPPTVPRRSDAGPAPLSFSQERLWILDRLAPGSTAYNLLDVVLLRGSLDAAVLNTALLEVLRRHEALRTVFEETDDAACQRVQPVPGRLLAADDLSGLPPDGRMPEVELRALAAARRPFDLAAGPLLRAELLRLGDREHALVLVMHHIVSDAWSFGIFLRELTALYQAFLEGKPSPLPEPEIQYADFAVWQREQLTSEVLAGHLAYWRERLAGAPPLLDLPADRPRLAVQGQRGGRVVQRFVPQLGQRLDALARSRGGTPFMALLAAFHALLGRSCGQEDLLVGAPIANRTQTETERLLGFFANTLVLRGDLSGDPSFGELFARARETTLGAYAHQDLPFEKLVPELQPERSLAHAPLVQVLLVLQNAPLGSIALPELTVELLPVQDDTARHDLSLALVELPDGLLATWEHDRDLFDGSTIERLAGRFERLLAAAADDPELRLSDLPLLSGEERHQVLAAWNDTARPVPPGLLHELVAAQAGRTPDALAVVSEDERITYRELAARARRLARRLRGLGCGPDVPVGVLMERSVEMVVALLAILEAGGAYLPLEPEHPEERLAWMVADAGAPLLVTQEHLAAALPSGPAVRVVALPPGWSGGEEGEDAAAPVPLPTATLPGHVAYVIYTSGSTGRPKGVMVPHRGIVNRLLWMQRAYGLTPADRVLQKTPFGFDVSVWEFFWPLATGARLVVARPGGHRDSACLAGLIAREEVTVTHFVPSMLRAFLEEPDLDGCATLRLVVASGEALPADLARRCRERLPARLENLYGPTEASVDVTAWSCASAGWHGALPIGRPIDNARTLVVDRWRTPAPMGVPGELCLGGAPLARGYLGRPDLAAERFVPDAWSPEAGERLYRTGDLVRWLPDGTLEFLGRIDHEVKIRGLRIDLGEVEAVLRAHPDLREAAVAVVGTPDSRRLAAYVVGDPGREPEAAELRRFLAEKLPAYMVPAVFVPLPALPLSTNGKVDRGALPAPPAGGEERAARAPANLVEAGLVEIFAELLDGRPAHPDDHFFTLGGDSIGALRLRTRIRRRFQVDLPLPRIFAHPTIAGLATVILEGQAGQESQDDLEALLAELEGMTDGEARELLTGGG